MQVHLPSGSLSFIVQVRLPFFYADILYANMVFFRSLLLFTSAVTAAAVLQERSTIAQVHNDVTAINTNVK